MSRGYITIAQNTADNDYLKMSYGLALSLKATQQENNICLCVDEETKALLEPKHYEVFNDIVQIPWYDHAKFEPAWKIHNKWKYGYMTPYDETVILDSDVVFTEDVSHWWKYMSKKDIWACTNVKTFRGENVTSRFYRKKFDAFNLPDIYTNFTYFKQSDLAFELFKLTEMIMNNWTVYYEQFLKGVGQQWLSADLAYALAIKLLDVESETTETSIKDMPTFVHMKSYAQNIPETKINSDWTQSISSSLNDDLSLTVGNFKQTLPFHYVEKHWMTDDKISKYEKALGL